MTKFSSLVTPKLDNNRCSQWWLFRQMTPLPFQFAGRLLFNCDTFLMDTYILKIIQAYHINDNTVVIWWWQTSHICSFDLMTFQYMQMRWWCGNIMHDFVYAIIVPMNTWFNCKFCNIYPSNLFVIFIDVLLRFSRIEVAHCLNVCYAHIHCFVTCQNYLASMFVCRFVCLLVCQFCQA